MPIDWKRLKKLTAREIISALIKDGFYLKSQKGSHQRYKHSDGRRVTISFHHSGETFTLKTLQSIIKDQAKWTEEDLKRLKLLKN
jgi:predicted RNA binding protein YcfA (HicA-like mRNA interferase family)